MEGREGFGRVPHKSTFTSLGTDRPTGLGGSGPKEGEGGVKPQRSGNPSVLGLRVNPVSGVRVKEGGARFKLSSSILKKILESPLRPLADSRGDPSFPPHLVLKRTAIMFLAPQFPLVGVCGRSQGVQGQGAKGVDPDTFGFRRGRTEDAASLCLAAHRSGDAHSTFRVMFPVRDKSSLVDSLGLLAHFPHSPAQGRQGFGHLRACSPLSQLQCYASVCLWLTEPQQGSFDPTRTLLQSEGTSILLRPRPLMTSPGSRRVRSSADWLWYVRR